jgi:hypothetical protein
VALHANAMIVAVREAAHQRVARIRMKLQLEALMFRVTIIVSLCAVAACSPRAGPHSSPHAAAMAESMDDRMPDRVGEFALTERTAVRGLPRDMMFRYSDGSATRLSVVVYDVGEDVKAEPDSQKWTAWEGEKFEAVQEMRRSRGEIAAYVVAFSGTAHIDAGDRQLLEHSVAVPVRSPNGMVSVEFQYLYLIGGRFVKVRATVPEQGWQQTKVPAFARELAQLLARGT